MASISKTPVICYNVDLFDLSVAWTERIGNKFLEVAGDNATFASCPAYAGCTAYVDEETARKLDRAVKPLLKLAKRTRNKYVPSR